MASFLCPPGFAGPRGLRAIVREGSAVAEAARYVARSAKQRLAGDDTPYASRHPVPGLAPVVLVPGFLAGDGSLGLMARHLRGLGHRTYRSAMYANVGCTRTASEALEERIEAIAHKRGRRVSVVGHSLGGLMARSVAARRPDLVGSIVTLGSPLLAPGAAHRVLLFDLALLVRLQRAGLGSMMGEDCTSGECARESWEQARQRLDASVQFTSVFSRRDGIVDWRGCLDPQARTVEVGTSHVGMAFDPIVLDIVARALAPQQSAQAPRLRPLATPSGVPGASAG